MPTDEEFRAAFLEHRNPIYRYAWRLTASPAAAEDITQEVFLALLRVRSLHSGHALGLRNFLFATARNLVLKFWRGKNRWAVIDEDDEQLCWEPDFVNSLDVSQAVATALQKLPPLQREVVVLSVYHGFSIAEIAGITEAHVTAVKARLHRARENLKRMLSNLKPAAMETEVESGTSY